MSTKKLIARTGTLLDKERLIKELQTAFTATEFAALVTFKGIDSNGREFSADFIFNHNDPEFRAMLNDYGARLAGKIIEETWTLVTPLAPADGMPVIGARDGKEALMYRIGGDWYVDNHGDGVKSDFIPSEYKPFGK